MNYKIVFYKDTIDEWRFRVVASNGRIVADSAEGYKSKFFCKRNAMLLKKKLSDATIEE